MGGLMPLAAVNKQKTGFSFDHAAFPDRFSGDSSLPFSWKPLLRSEQAGKVSHHIGVFERLMRPDAACKPLGHIQVPAAQ
jgi:hypothetical protein